MRLLSLSWNAPHDPGSGQARTLRTLAEWAAEAGHEVAMLGVGRMEGLGHFRYREHLDGLGTKVAWRSSPEGGEVASYRLGGVDARLVAARAGADDLKDPAAVAAYLGEFESLERPDVVVALGGHPAVREAMRRARAMGAKTALAVRFYGFEDRRFFLHADAAWTPSGYLSDHYARAIGLRSVPLPSPISEAETLTPPHSEETRVFLTFVNPSLRKGLALFARLAEVLGSRRPDIPMLVVKSGSGVDALRAVPGMDLARHPNLMVMEPTERPRDFLALTRVLLVPSAGAEPHGRVNAEAMLNGIPVVASDRGGIPEALGGTGIVLPLPEWMTDESVQVPTEEEARRWVEAVERLWDDPAYYATVAAAEREEASRRHAESVLKAAHLGFLEDLRLGRLPTPFGSSG